MAAVLWEQKGATRPRNNQERHLLRGTASKVNWLAHYQLNDMARTV
jgi:hypothetical protein